MISRVLIKDFLSFKDAEVRFERGLNVLTGASGAGKSVLIAAVLAACGLGEAQARMVEVDFVDDGFGAGGDDCVVGGAGFSGNDGADLNLNNVSAGGVGGVDLPNSNLDDAAGENSNLNGGENGENSGGGENDKNGENSNVGGDTPATPHAPHSLAGRLAALGIEPEAVNSFKLIRERQARYFVNNQAISKKHLAALGLVRHLSTREVREFDNARLLALLDALAAGGNGGADFGENGGDLSGNGGGNCAASLGENGWNLGENFGENGTNSRAKNREKNGKNLAQNAEIPAAAPAKNNKIPAATPAKTQPNPATPFGADFLAAKREFATLYGEFCAVRAQLEAVQKDERRLEELKEFAKFEFDKIRAIDPKPDELDELNRAKKRLSAREKIEQAWERAGGIFAYESAVLHALALCERDTAFFSEAMNELRAASAEVDFSEFDDLDIEALLDRIEALTGLQKRYGSIDEALAVMARRKAELARYETIEFEKGELVARFGALRARLDGLAAGLSRARAAVCGRLEARLNGYLARLYLGGVKVELGACELGALGADAVSVNLGATNIKKISSGELNRLRLAFLAAQNEILGGAGAGFCGGADFGGGDLGADCGGAGAGGDLGAGSGGGTGANSNLSDGRGASEVLILDEIDSNLSGKEAASVAQVLLELARNYQIIAISHQLQLSVLATHHFVVERGANGASSVRKITRQERIDEISRMISGASVTPQTRAYAEELLAQTLAQNGEE